MGVCVLAFVASMALGQATAVEPAMGPPAPGDAMMSDAQVAAREKARAEAKAKADAQRAAAERLKERQQRPDRDTIGERLAVCAAIVPGDLVMVRGGARDAALLEAIAAQVRRRGGAPLVVLAGDRLEEQQFDQAPVGVEAKPNELELKLASDVTAVIDVEADESPTELGHIPGARLAARARGVALADEIMRRRGVRRVELGNGLYPSARLANDYSMSEEEWSRVFWLAVTADAAAMRESGTVVGESLGEEGRVSITNPNGTDLKFRLAKRARGAGDETGMMMAAAGASEKTSEKAVDKASEKGGESPPMTPPAISDGMKSGVLAARLPAGELVALAAPGTAEGRLVADRVMYDGWEVTGLSITFRGGRVTGISARSGSEYIRKVYDASGAGKDQLGAVVIGLNPDLRPPSGVKVCSTIPEGMVSVVIGGNSWAGGDNTEAFTLPVCVPGSTLKVDGRLVVEEGVLTPTSPLPPEEPAAPADAAARK